MKPGLLLLLALVACAGGDAQPETRAPENARGAKPSLLPERHYSVAGVRVGRGGLEQIVSSLGPAQTAKGAHLSKRICYIGSSGTHLVFETTAVGFGYSAYSASKEPELDCAPSFAVAADAPNGAGLRLGLENSEVVELLGAPTRLRDDEASYFYWLQVAVPQEEPETAGLPDTVQWLDVYSGISLRFQDGRVAQYSVFTTETY